MHTQEGEREGESERKREREKERERERERETFRKSVLREIGGTCKHMPCSCPSKSPSTTRLVAVEQRRTCSEQQRFPQIKCQFPVGEASELRVVTIRVGGAQLEQRFGVQLPCATMWRVLLVLSKGFASVMACSCAA